MVFSDTTNYTGIVERARIIARVDATQWPTSRIVNSANDRLDKIMNYGISADRRFQLDDTNHTKLPIGTTSLVLDQTDYSFLTDEQGNRIINITRLALVDSDGQEQQLVQTNIGNVDYDSYSYGALSGTPTRFDKIADNIVRLNYKPTAENVTDYDLKFYFQRTPSYFVATDTTKEPGFANDLHRGIVIQCAYDAAFTLGLENVNQLANELAKEDMVMANYFANRNTDELKFFTPIIRSSR
jgi:hypothetical protein